jgi:hypothetical protein
MTIDWSPILMALIAAMGTGFGAYMGADRVIMRHKIDALESEIRTLRAELEKRKFPS